MIYLDNSATTRQYDEVTELIYRAAKENFGNPSSLHAMGFEAGNLLYDARRQIADLLPPAAFSAACMFTSSGSNTSSTDDAPLFVMTSMVCGGRSSGATQKAG